MLTTSPDTGADNWWLVGDNWWRLVGEGLLSAAGWWQFVGGSLLVAIGWWQFLGGNGLVAIGLGNLKRRRRCHPEINEQAEIKVWLWSY